MQRGHRRPGVAAQRAVHLRPGRAPGVFADADHDPLDLLAGQPLLRGPPGRRGRDHEVGDAADVEDRGHLAGGAREPLRVAPEDPGQGEVGLEEPEPVRPGEDAVDGADAAQARHPPLQAGVGQAAEPDHPVGDDRVAAAQPRLQPLRIVVGKLVDHDEGPHLHRVERHVALARARVENGDRQRPRRAGRDGHRSGRPQSLAQQRNGHRGGDEHRLLRSAPRGEAPEMAASGLHQVGEYRSRWTRERIGQRRRAAPRD